MAEQHRIKLFQIDPKEQALGGWTRQEVEKHVLRLVYEKLKEMDMDKTVDLLGARVYGSRSREGLFHAGSDLDVVLSYSGPIREDDFFNILHDETTYISGIVIDINPISLEKSGALDDFMQKAEEYLDNKILLTLES